MPAFRTIQAWLACALPIALLAGCVQMPAESASIVSSPAAPTSEQSPTATIPLPQPSLPVIATPQSTSGQGEQTSSLTAQTGSSCIPLGESALLLRWSDKAVQHLLTPIDPLTGLPVCGLEPIGLGLSSNVAHSPDGSSLAAVIYHQEDARDSQLHLIDLRNWQAQETGLKFDSWTGPLVFSPDGSRLALVFSGPGQGAHGIPAEYFLTVVEVSARRQVAELSLDFVPRLLEYSIDGTELVVYGAPTGPDGLISGDPRILLLDAGTLSIRWEHSLPGLVDGQVRQEDTPEEPEFAWLSPAAVFSPKDRRLYIVHAGEERLTSVDFERQTTVTLEIQPKQAWIEPLLALTAGVAHAKVLDGTSKTAILSPDGERLFVSGVIYDSWKDENGDWQFSETGLGLQVIEISSGLELARMENGGIQLALSEDGSRLYMSGWKDTSTWTDVIDGASLATIAHLPSLQLVPTRRLDGSEILLSSAYRNSSGLVTLALVDPETLAPLHEWSAVYASWLDFP